MWNCYVVGIVNVSGMRSVICIGCLNRMMFRGIVISRIVC